MHYTPRGYQYYDAPLRKRKGETEGQRSPHPRICLRQLLDFDGMDGLFFLLLFRDEEAKDPVLVLRFDGLLVDIADEIGSRSAAGEAFAAKERLRIPAFILLDGVHVDLNGQTTVFVRNGDVLLFDPREIDGHEISVLFLADIGTHRKGAIAFARKGILNPEELIK